MKTPLISIITINLNSCEGLKKTLSSIFEQTYRKFELIVIDGASTDGSAEFIESIEDKISYWVSEKDNGIYNAMNKGILQANGEYILFLNSGDHFISSDTLMQCESYLKNEDIIYFDVLVKSEEVEYLKCAPEVLSFDFFRSDSLPHQGTFIRSCAFQRVGLYDENYKIISDWKFTAAGFQKYGLRFKKVNIVLSVFQKDGISSTQRDLLHLERQEVMENEFQEILRTEGLERFRENVKASKSIRFLRRLGFLKWIN